MKPTTAQLWLIHSLEALGTTSVLTIVLAVYNAISAGNFNLPMLLVAIAGLLGTVLSTGLKAILLNRQALQAATDTLTEVKNGLATFGASHHLLSQTILAFLGQQVAANTPVAVPVPVQPPFPAAPLPQVQPAPMPDWMQGLSPVPSAPPASTLGSAASQPFPVQPQPVPQATPYYGQISQSPFPSQAQPAAPSPGSTSDYTLSGPWATVSKPQ